MSFIKILLLAQIYICLSIDRSDDVDIGLIAKERAHHLNQFNLNSFSQLKIFLNIFEKFSSLNILSLTIGLNGFFSL